MNRPMRTITLITGCALLLAGCMKDTEELAQDMGVLPSTCGSAGARMQATIDGSSYCATGQVIATSDGSSAVVTGVSLLGTTLVLQLDSLGLGTQAMTEASNGLLYMENGTSYTIMSPDQGSLSITHVDTVARALKADFEAVLRNEMSGATRAVQGSLDVVWAE